MTREEEIKEAGTLWVKDIKKVLRSPFREYPSFKDVFDAFIHGAEWADENPQSLKTEITDKNLSNVFGKENFIVENPLVTNNIVSVEISYYKNCIVPNGGAFGKILFSRNNTDVSQRFQGDTLSDVYLQILKFCRSLGNN